MLVGGGGKQWDVLIHNGPMFAPPYEPHNIPIIISGKKHQLNHLAEEYITMYARYVNTEYTNITNHKSLAMRFNKNFLNDWSKVLPAHIKVTNMSDVDMTDIINHQKKKKRIKKQMILLKNHINIVLLMEDELKLVITRLNPRVYF
jgi:DNA topoisomerase-1